MAKIKGILAPFMGLAKHTTNGSLWAYAFLIGALFIFVKGYQFNTADQAEHLPQVYKMLDPELYPKDYFVEASSGVFTVRFYYEQTALWVAKTVGLEWGLFALTIAYCALMVYSIMRISLAWFNNKWAMWLAPIFVMLLFYNYTVGGNHVIYGSLISSTIAKSLGCFGLFLVIDRKWWASGAVLGIATLYQPLVGLQLFVLLAGYKLLESKFRNWSAVFKLSVPFLAIAAFILIPVLKRQFLSATPIDPELYYDILYRFRNHYHYLPSLFPLTHYLKLIGLIALGWLSYFITQPNDRGVFRWFVPLAIIGCLFYWLALEHFGLLGVGKTQWFKSTVWIAALCAILVAGLIGQLIENHSFRISTKRNFTAIYLIIAVLLIVTVTNSKYLPEQFQHKYMIGERVHSDLEKMHDWISQNTKRTDIFLVSPANNGFSCQAKRPMPIHYQAIIHEPFFMLPWYEDFKKIYGVGIDNMNEMDARKQAAELYSVRNYRGSQPQIDYRLDNKNECEFASELGEVVYEQGPWILTKFAPE